MNPILFSILVLVSCPSDVCKTLEEHAAENNCTVEELMTEIVTARLCGRVKPDGEPEDECMHGAFTISQRDEESARDGIIIEHLRID